MISQENVAGPTTEVLHVWHVGIVGDFPGGMAQVVNEYLSWKLPNLIQNAILTTRGKRDPKALYLFFVAILKILSLRDSRASTVLVFHVSERGSFIREGSLLALSRLIGLATVAQLHGANFDEFADKHGKLVRWILANAHKVLVLSSDSQATLSRLGITSSISRNPVSAPENRDKLAKQKWIIFCGELSKRKGVDVLLSAWEGLQNRGDWVLHLVGPVAWEGIHDKSFDDIHVYGALEHEEAMKLCMQSSIAVLPSRDEALPMFLLEAMIRNCAVISTPVGQIGALLSEDCGRLVDVGDADSLSRELDSLIENQDLRKRIASNGLNRVMHGYSTAVVRVQLESYWRDAFSQSRNKK